MLPEVMHGNPVYTDKLDIFSFGILMLYLVVQEEPILDESALEPSHVSERRKIIGRRKLYLDQLKAYNEVYCDIAVSCLLDKPELRPNAAKLSDDYYCTMLSAIQMEFLC